MNKFIACISLAIFLSACGQNESNESAESPPVPEPAMADAEAVDSSVYANAVANAARLEGDRDKDATRKPEAVLEFMGIAPGDQVLEMYAGGGYYTELLAHVVGENGSVVAHNNKPLLNFAGDEFEARHADNRLANVEVLMAENNELTLEADQFDAVTLVLNYHDLYWVSEENGWDQVDVPTFLAELHKSMKPGAVLGVVDHDAEAGSPAETGGTLHRIARDLVIGQVEAAGFALDGESDALRNTTDDHSKNVFDPEVRGKTDRFVLRFKKPAA